MQHSSSVRSHNQRTLWRITVLVPLLLLEWLRPTWAADAPAAEPRLVAAIDRLVRRQGVKDDEPGVAIWIYEPGKLFFQKGYGVTSLTTKERITPRTNFELASLSKTITATAVLILYDRGKLSLDGHLRTVLPPLVRFHPEQPIRVIDLLRHVSGLPDYLVMEDVPRRHRDYWDNDDYVHFFATHARRLALDFPHDFKYDYNNTNFLMLASIVKHVSGKSFGQFVRDEIFAPAGMEHTFIYESPQSVPPLAPGRNRAVGYEWDEDNGEWEETWGAPPARYETALVAGDGSIWSSVEDLARWDAVVRARRLLKPETWKLALTPHRTKDGNVNPYGLGWELYFEKPPELYGYGHDGSWGGFQTAYYHYLTKDRSTIFLSNRGTFDTDKLWDALDALLDAQKGVRNR